MVLKCFLILSRVCFWAQMNHTFLSTHKEQMIFEWVEVETHTSCKAIKESFLLSICLLFFCVLDQFEFDYFFSFKFVLHKVPVGNATIWRDWIEAQILSLVFLLPANLPDRISVFMCAHCWLIDGLVGWFKSYIKDHYSTVITTCSDQSWMCWVEVDAHDTWFCGEGEFWPSWILYSETANQACHWL